MNDEDDFIRELNSLYNESKIMHIASLLKDKSPEMTDVGFPIEDVLIRASSMDALREQCLTDDGSYIRPQPGGSQCAFGW
jgi:hypothetical protein